MRDTITGLILTLLVISIFLGGCAQVRVVGFNNKAHTVSVRGNKFASQDLIQRKAEQHCGGPAKVISMGGDVVGAYTDGYGVTQTIERDVFTFECSL